MKTILFESSRLAKLSGVPLVPESLEDTEDMGQYDAEHPNAEGVITFHWNSDEEADTDWKERQGSTEAFLQKAAYIMIGDARHESGSVEFNSILSDEEVKRIVLNSEI
jgi:hypothetical protein